MNWIITQLDRNAADGGVTMAHWRVSAEETVGTDDDAVTYSASSYGACGFIPDASADGFVAYADLTEAQVLNWVWNVIEKDDIEASLTAKIEEDKTPVTITGTPW